jgi:hypothetical protein
MFLGNSYLNRHVSAHNDLCLLERWSTRW